MISPFTVFRRAGTVFSLVLRIFLAYQTHRLAGLLRNAVKQAEHRSLLHRKYAVHIRHSAIRLKGIFIKVGQMMSTRIDLLPEEYTEELSILQDQVPPAEFPEIQKALTSELGRELDQVFGFFSPTPIAAASLGQVHEAYLRKDGRKVAVKVQYPGIQQIVAADLKMARWLIWLLNHWFPHVWFDVLYKEFSRVIHAELDYIQEGHNAERFHNNFSGHESIFAPGVVWEHTTRRVLTLEYLEGIKINQFEEIRAKGIELKAVASLLAESYMYQILEHRFFHGDPHPGNLFVQAGPNGKPRLIFVDFGQMQSITPEMHAGIKQTIQAIILRDTPSIVSGLVELGFIERGHLHDDIETAVDFFMTRYRDIKPREFRNITITNIAQDIIQLFRISPILQIPNHFILFARTAMMLNGICSKLDPDLNIIELAKPHAQRFITSEEGLIYQMVKSGEEMGRLLIRLPKKLDEFLTTAKIQGVKTHMSSQDMTGILTKIYRLGQKAIMASLVLGLAFLYSHFKRNLMETEAWATAGAILLISVALLWSLMRER